MKGTLRLRTTVDPLAKETLMTSFTLSHSASAVFIPHQRRHGLSTSLVLIYNYEQSGISSIYKSHYNESS